MSEIVERAIPADAADAADAADWILAIAQGDRSSFVSLFNRFAPNVKAYLLRHGVSEPIAEELTQDTFLIVWRKAQQFDPGRARAGAWIYTIARHLWVDQLRRERAPADSAMGETPPAPRSPEDELTAWQSDAQLRAAIDALPAEQAQVLRMSFFEDQTHPEIAERLTLPLGTVKSRIRLASAHLRSVLGPTT